MGLMQRQVYFKAFPPTIETITAKLRDTTDVEISFEQVLEREESNEIFSEELRQTFHLDISAKDDSHLCYLFTTDLGASYLLDSAVFVLISLGGTWPYTLPTWTGLPWKIAKERFYKS